LSILESGEKLLQPIRSKSSSTAMQLRAKRFGSMPIPFQSIKYYSWQVCVPPQEFKRSQRCVNLYGISECISQSDLLFIFILATQLSYSASTWLNKSCIIYFASPHQANPNSLAVQSTHRFMIV
jgi:hypothetical protein